MGIRQVHMQKLKSKLFNTNFNDEPTVISNSKPITANPRWISLIENPPRLGEIILIVDTSNCVKSGSKRFN